MSTVTATNPAPTLNTAAAPAPAAPKAAGKPRKAAVVREDHYPLLTPEDRTEATTRASRIKSASDLREYGAAALAAWRKRPKNDPTAAVRFGADRYTDPSAVASWARTMSGMLLTLERAPASVNYRTPEGVNVTGPVIASSIPGDRTAVLKSLK